MTESGSIRAKRHSERSPRSEESKAAAAATSMVGSSASACMPRLIAWRRDDHNRSTLVLIFCTPRARLDLRTTDSPGGDNSTTLLELYLESAGASITHWGYLGNSVTFRPIHHLIVTVDHYGHVTSASRRSGN